MAKRNKRKGKSKKKYARARKPGIRSVFPRTLFGILLMLTVFALSYLYLCGRCDALGKNIYQLEKQRADLRREIVNEEFKWSNMTSPENMEKLFDKHNIIMIWPSEDSVRRIRRNPLPQQFARDTSIRNFVHD